MSPDGQSIANTSAQLEFTFEPASSDSLPPKVTSVSPKITAVTYFSSSAIKSFPNLGDWSRNLFCDGSGSYSSTTALPSIPTGQVVWKQHLTAKARRDSGYCSEALPDSDHCSDGDERQRTVKSKTKHKTPPIYHTASLQVPIKLPTEKKTFIPTFHSCITSRVYVLGLTLALSTGGFSSNLTLSVPLQVGVESLEAPVDHMGPPSFQSAIEDAEVDEFLRPRVLSIPGVDFESDLPAYRDLISRGRATAPQG